jgi:predicted transposase YbfD/YdcC
LTRLIKVERTRVNHEHIHQVTGYYICSYALDDAKLMYGYIKDVWGIENRLHWVKDVIMKEDTSKTAKGMAAQNISIIRNIAINIYRTSGIDSIKYATQMYANNVKELMKLIKKASTKKRI